MGTQASVVSTYLLHDCSKLLARGSHSLPYVCIRGRVARCLDAVCMYVCMYINHIIISYHLLLLLLLLPPAPAPVCQRACQGPDVAANLGPRDSECKWRVSMEDPIISGRKGPSPTFTTTLDRDCICNDTRESTRAAIRLVDPCLPSILLSCTRYAYITTRWDSSVAFHP
jgi:hypothetical protein